MGYLIIGLNHSEPFKTQFKAIREPVLSFAPESQSLELALDSPHTGSRQN
jgi:hypothetical protein